ncbi:ABC transporter substrate-binding protein [Paramesorhizobium deserti]|uniref:ABC transporter substrate-binding protein n=1 Tax=Paramesorhizobium deserti TaxID=1494590 RepID=A0A135HWK1_9HYPH|nr:ABC transporter substrate-binding protein [Paramesorhizobium deserti]KXF77538.1 ABC transporter substrate-binding protein [Paramesorhizobium deserti]
MVRSRKYRLLLTLVIAALAGILTSATLAAERMHVGVLKFGTVSWELDTIKTHGLDEKNGVEIDIRFFASEDATNVALMAGDIDVMVSDWLWVSRQRSAGEDLTFFPYSTSVGAMMVPAASPIKSLTDLKAKKIGVAGGPLDKSWLFIQGLARDRFGIDLADENEIVYGAPPLLAEKARQGELDAVLNFWHYCARLEADGFRRLVSANEAARALGATGDVSAIGYIFHEKWARSHPEAIEGFLKASGEAKALLNRSDEEWPRLEPVVRAEGRELDVLRDRYREGIPNRTVEEEEEDAARLYTVLMRLGGERLVGPGKTLAPGTFWRVRE